MSISNLYPAISPTLNLSFALTKALDPRISFVRTTTATYYGTETAKAEENLMQYSQEFNDAYYTKLRTTVSANATTAPDGTSTADALTQATGQTTSGAVYPAANIAYSASTYIFSVFAKPNGKDFIRLAMVDGGSTFRECYFDVNNGTVGTANNGAVGTITASADGYYRCSIAYTFSSASNMSPRVFLADTDNSIVVVDSGGVYLWGAQLEQRSAVTSYTPTTTQPITNYIPVLETAASGVARFDHNPTTFESLGLLVEEQRTNELTYSAELDGGVGAYTDVASASNFGANIAPNGSLTATLIVPDTTSAFHGLNGSPFVSSGTTYCLSVYAKAAGYNFLRMGWNGSRMSGVGASYFDLSNGTVATQGANSVATIQAVGNGWYRCSITGLCSSSGTSGHGFFYASQTNNQNQYTGDGYSGVFIWGAQLEAAAFPTSYIPTVASTVTRNADAASMTGTNFSSWYRQDEGTFYGETTFITGDVRQLFQVTGAGTVANDIGINSASASVNPRLRINVNSVNQAEPSVTLAADTLFKAAGAYKVNNVNIGVNGSLGTLDTDATIPVVDRLFIGARDGGSRNLNTCIRKLAFYPIRATDAQLQALTS